LTVRASLLAAILLAVAASGCASETQQDAQPAGNQQDAQPAETRQATTRTLETIDGLEVDLSLLPPDLQPLAPLIRKYAAGDDVERTDRLYAASTEELRELDRAMTARRWESVDAFHYAHIEATGTPEQDVALVLSSFAEAAAEAAVILEEREGSG
jgi:hypothetical protein